MDKYLQYTQSKDSKEITMGKIKWEPLLQVGQVSRCKIQSLHEKDRNNKIKFAQQYNR